MTRLPQWIKILIRIILLPIVFAIHIIPYAYSLFYNLYLWVRYGGEFITYRKGDRESIKDIFNELKNQNNDKD